jgi:hypothetical protein
MSGIWATLGTACHEWLEWLVSNGHHTTMPFEVAIKEWELIASRASLSDDHKIDGRKMLKKWWDYHEQYGFDEVISTERKETFTLTHPDYDDIEVTFIWDRGDLEPDGSIKIVDYKTFGQPMAADLLKSKVQPRVYALSAAIKFKDREPANIWVEYWLLRFGPIAVRFTRQDNIATWRYLQDVYGRIKESDGTKETINSECKWCVRKAICTTLHKHAAVGGVLGMDTKQQAVVYAQTQDKLKALKNLSEELEIQLTDYLEQSDLIEDVFDDVRVYIKPTNRREADGERVAKVVGPVLAAKYGSLGVGSIDDMLKNEELTDAQRLELKRLIRNKPGAQLKVDVKTPFDEM